MLEVGYMNKLVAGMVVAIVAVAVVLPARAAGNCTATPTSLNDPLTAGVWNQLMATRHASGLTDDFTWSPTLAQAAAWMARDNAQRGDYHSQTDSLGRNTRTRDTDCGYRSDAQVLESGYWAYQQSDPIYAGNVFNSWRGNGPNMYSIIYSYSGFPPVYTVGALGRYHLANGLDYWVLDVGTLADGGVQPQPTSTPQPQPTATPQPTPQPTSTPVPTPSNEVNRTCTVDRDIQVDQPFVLSCES